MCWVSNRSYRPDRYNFNSCSRRLTLVRSSTFDLSPLESILRLFVALERDFVEIEGALPVDHTPMIKSVRVY